MTDEELQKWITTAAEYWVEFGNSDDSPVEQELIRQGCDQDLAFLIVEYLPIALAEHAVQNLGVTRAESYNRQHTDGSSSTYRWSDDPIYMAVCDFRNLNAAERWQDYKMIAACSADLDAISNALNAGKEVSGGRIAIAVNTVLPVKSPWLPDNKV